MPKFTYAARDSSGNSVSGVDEADTSADVVGRLQMRGFYVTNVRLCAATLTPRAEAAIKVKGKKFTHGGVNEADLNLFARQLAISLDSGVLLLKCLDAIARQTSSRKFYDIIIEIIRNVEGGLSLKNAIAKYPHIFSNLWINMIETGEASGNLPVILDKLANYLDKRAAFKSKIISALIYPAILMAVAVGAVVIFILVVIPKFTEIFSNFDMALPLPTKMLMMVSGALRKSFFFVVLALSVIIFLLRNLIRKDAGKKLFDRFILSIPLVSDFLRLSETERFAASMATLLESGVPILYSLEIAESSSDNVVVKDIIRTVKESVREGKTLTGPLEKSGFFPPMVIQMVSMGEEIGELDKMFKKISVFYAEMMETQVTRLATMFEPIMIVFMGGIIGSMVISMFLPIFKLATIGGK